LTTLEGTKRVPFVGDFIDAYDLFDGKKNPCCNMSLGVLAMLYLRAMKMG
jgi:hypothetical protein